MDIYSVAGLVVASAIFFALVRLFDFAKTKHKQDGSEPIRNQVGAARASAITSSKIAAIGLSALWLLSFLFYLLFESRDDAGGWGKLILIFYLMFPAAAWLIYAALRGKVNKKKESGSFSLSRVLKIIAIVIVSWFALNILIAVFRG